MNKLTLKKAKEGLYQYENSLNKIKNMNNFSAMNHLQHNHMEFGFCSYFDYKMDIERHHTSEFLQLGENDYICDTPMTFYRDNKSVIIPIKKRISYFKKIIKHHEAITIKRTDD